MRLYSQERWKEPTSQEWKKRKWCDFNPDEAEDVELFRQILGERASFWSCEFDVPTQPLLARISIDGPWGGNLELARRLLYDVCAKWPKGLRTLSISTCGAFLTFNWPSRIAEQSNNWFPDPASIHELETAGRLACETLLSGGLREELGQRADFLSIGVDTTKTKISFAENQITEPHAELVYVVNLKSGRSHFTGKSYPTPGQEHTLLRIPELETHFVEMNGVVVMVLGCHDLMIFNPRGDKTAKGQRAAVREQFKQLSLERKPRVVLHHPHTTIKMSTWRQAWSNLKKTIDSVESFVGTGCYSYKDDWQRRDSRSKVLESTKSHNTVDVVVRLAEWRSTSAPK
jgi:hypothetical protein